MIEYIGDTYTTMCRQSLSQIGTIRGGLLISAEVLFALIEVAVVLVSSGGDKLAGRYASRKHCLGER